MRRIQNFWSAILAGLLMGVGALSCASVDPHSSVGPLRLADDERRIWNRGGEEAKRLDSSGQLYEEAALVQYVNGVAGKLLPERSHDPHFEMRVRIIENPYINAFALPQGAIYIHTGMLARMENEAQLAAVIAHEMTHVTHRHALQHFRTVQNASAALAVLGVLTLPGGQFGSLVGLLGAISATAAVSGYSRDMERDADGRGFDLLVRAGYDPREAPKLFEQIKRELEERKIDEPFFFGSHPRLAERQQNFSALADNHAVKKVGHIGAERFAGIMEPVFIADARMNLSMGRWGRAEESIKKVLSGNPRIAEAHFLLGELHRRRAEEDDLVKAAKNYRAALVIDSAFAPAYKGLGLVQLKQKHTARALQSFERYLALAPDATDRAYIEGYLKKAEQSE